MKEVTDKQFEKVFKNDCNRSYIAWRLKMTEDEAEELIQKLLKEGKIKESEYAKNYYGKVTDSN